MPKGEKKNDGKGKLLNKAYGAATAKLRDAHRDEFNRLYQAEAAELGVEWKPKLTPEQKAKNDLDAILAEYPHLADDFREREPEVPAEA